MSIILLRLLSRGGVTTILLAIVMSACSSTGGMLEHPPADQIHIAWGVVGHTDQGVDTELIIRNDSRVALPDEDWALYFSYWLAIDPASVSEEVSVEHLSGDLYRMRPNRSFRPIAPGDSLRITMRSPGSAVSRAYGPDGFYFVWDEDGDAVVDAVGDPDVLPYTRPEQTMRGTGDRLPLVTPELRYRKNEAVQPVAEVPLIMPRPESVIESPGTFTIGRSTVVFHDEALASEAAFLADALAEVTGSRPEIRTGGNPPANAIHLSIWPSVGSEEAYRLEVSEGVRILGIGAPGVFYGIQTLRHLFPLEVFENPAASFEIPRVVVTDAPRFPYRGMHLDVARNFQSLEDVKMLLDMMSFYKLNKFHFHLSDDEGWRIEIEELPELTQIGGRRGHTLTEEEFLRPAYGSGPVPGRAPGSGFYTREQFKEILRYAAQRHIEVIPEIDTPGHSRAAIIAMKARARRTGSDEFLLAHPDDESQYMSVQSYRDNVIDVCLPSTYRFLETVVADLVEMYNEAQVDFRTLHVGGDEVPQGVWQGSPACRALFASNSEVNDVADLHDYFFGRFDDILDRYGLTTAGWEEIALRHKEGGGYEPNPAFVGEGIQANVWNAVWGWGGEGLAYALANAGYDVVISNASNYYFDMPYEKHPEEEGLYWAGFIDTMMPFAFSPMDLYTGAEVDLMGRPIDPSTYARHERLTEEGRKHILGIQGQLWSENIRSSERLQYMLFPRLIALAQRAWSRETEWEWKMGSERRTLLQEEWNQFATALGRRELRRLDAMHGGILYRIPPPGAVIEGGMLKANVELPGFTIRYTTDGSEPTAASTPYRAPVAVNGVVKLKAFNSAGRGSRTVIVQP